MAKSTYEISKRDLWLLAVAVALILSVLFIAMDRDCVSPTLSFASEEDPKLSTQQFSKEASELSTQQILCPREKFKDLAYPLPKYWGLPSLPIVLETEPRTCDLFGGIQNCLAFSEMRHYEPDPHVREVLMSIVSDCNSRSCFCVDVGSNIGYFSLWMAAFGSEVFAVEPQILLAEAFNKTIQLNCLEDKVKLFNGFATTDAANRGKSQRGGKNGWTFGEGLRSEERDIPFVVLQDHIKGREVELIKIDTDAVDGEIIQGIIDMIKRKELVVHNMEFEFSGGTPQMLFDLQDLGYTIYRLNIHDDRRHFDENGHDVISHGGDIKLEDYYEERYFLRGIRYCFEVKKGLALEDFVRINTPRAGMSGWALQFLVTDRDLKQPSPAHPAARDRPNGDGE